MDSSQRLFLIAFAAVVLALVGRPQPSYAELNGIPVWSTHDHSDGEALVMTSGQCRSDIYPDTEFDCLLQPGMVLIPGQACTYGHPNAYAWGLPLDLNHHSASALQAISGIGPATAAAIVQYRSVHGPYTDMLELQNIKGIGPATYKKLKPYLRIQPSSDSNACPSNVSHSK